MSKDAGVQSSEGDGASAGDVVGKERPNDLVESPSAATDAQPGSWHHSNAALRPRQNDDSQWASSRWWQWHRKSASQSPDWAPSPPQDWPNAPPSRPPCASFRPLSWHEASPSFGVGPPPGWSHAAARRSAPEHQRHDLHHSAHIGWQPQHSWWHEPPPGYGPLPHSRLPKEPSAQSHDVRERSRSRSPAPVRDENYLRHTLLKAGLRRALENDELDLAIKSIHGIVALGKDVGGDSLYKSLEAACKKVDGNKLLLAMLQCCASAKLRLSPNEYATLLGILMSRRACTASIRAFLNVCLPVGASAISLVPDGCTDEEARVAFEDIPKPSKPDCSGAPDFDKCEDQHNETVNPFATVKKDDPVGRTETATACEKDQHNETVNPFATVKKDDPVGRTETATACEKAWRCIIEDGVGIRSQPDFDATRTGGKIDHLHVFKVSVRTEKNVEGLSIAFLKLADGQGWVFDRHPEAGVVCELNEATPVDQEKQSNKAPESKRSHDASEAKQSLNASASSIDFDSDSLDLLSLRGLLHSPRECITSYFGHFMALLHLERLADLGTFQRRFSQMSVERSTDLGFTLTGLKAVDTYGKRHSRKGLLPGWQDNGAEFVKFKVSSDFDLDRLRIRTGGSVIVSRTDPRVDAIGEGSVDKLDGCNLVVNLCTTVPEDLWERTWRVDAYAVRVVYERQLSALLSIVERQQTDPMCDLFVTADVGKLDSWATKWTGSTQSNTEIPAASEQLDSAHQKEPHGERSNIQGPQNSSSTGPNDGEHPEQSQDEQRPLVHTSSDRCVELASADPYSESAEVVSERRVAIEGSVESYTNLNDSQRSAVIEATTRRCTIVQGPPGTGKTHVSVKVLRTWVKVCGFSPILATSDSNVAVDNIAEGLHRAGIRAVRVGRPEKCREHLEGITLDSLMAERRNNENGQEREIGAQAEVGKRKRKEYERAHEQKESSSELVGDSVSGDAVKPGAEGAAANAPDDVAKETECGVNDVWKASAAVNDEAKDSKLRARNGFNKRQAWADKQARAEILQDAEVICTTTMGAGSETLKNFSFQAVLIDEVAQATEISTIVPVVLCGSKQLVLVGDHCQLAPTCLSREAELRGLSLSLYQRLADVGIKPCFLDTQYRSHPKLAEFSAKCFYNGALKSDVAEAARPVPKNIPWPNPRIPVAFLEVGTGEVVDGESKSNQGEAECMVRLVQEALQAGELRLGDIGVVTPYMAQVRLLRRMLHERLPQDPEQFLEVASVDNFQGREKELIIFSAVRSNRHGNVGFLADWRRLNVMLTRARCGLVVIGCAQTLSNDSNWKQWLEWCREHDAIGKAPDSWIDSAWRKRRHEHSVEDWDEDGAYEHDDWQEEDEWAEEFKPSPFTTSAGHAASPFTTTASPFTTAASPFTTATPVVNPFAVSSMVSPVGARNGTSPFSTCATRKAPDDQTGQLLKRAKFLTAKRETTSARVGPSVPWRESHDMSDDDQDAHDDISSVLSDSEGQSVPGGQQPLVKHEAEQGVHALNGIDMLIERMKV